MTEKSTQEISARRLTIMTEKILQLAMQIALCILLLWLTKGLSGKFSITHLVIVYILSFVLTKAFLYCISQWKMRTMKEKIEVNNR